MFDYDDDINASNDDREQTLDSPIPIPDLPKINKRAITEMAWTVTFEGKEIAHTWADWDRAIVTFKDVGRTSVEFKNMERCGALLSFRNVIDANASPFGASALANSVLHVEAEIEAEKIAQAISARLETETDERVAIPVPARRL
jgi:hypothetical protein